MNNELAIIKPSFPAMKTSDINKVRRAINATASKPQAEYKVDQFIHNGLYVRTGFLTKTMYLTGALIKIPTTLIISGDVTAFIGNSLIRFTGYHTVTAEAYRQQVFYAHEDTYLTMMFPTNAKTCEEAEEEFTDDYAILTTRRTGEYKGDLCQVV